MGGGGVVDATSLKPRADLVLYPVSSAQVVQVVHTTYNVQRKMAALWWHRFIALLQMVVPNHESLRDHHHPNRQILMHTAFPRRKRTRYADMRHTLPNQKFGISHGAFCIVHIHFPFFVPPWNNTRD